jgi:hypothetical protein
VDKRKDTVRVEGIYSNFNFGQRSPIVFFYPPLRASAEYGESIKVIVVTYIVMGMQVVHSRESTTVTVGVERESNKIGDQDTRIRMASCTGLDVYKLIRPGISPYNKKGSFSEC